MPIPPRVSEVAAALAGQPTGEAVLSIHLTTDGEVDTALQEAVRAGGVVVKRATPTPVGGSYGFFADPVGWVRPRPQLRCGPEGLAGPGSWRRSSRPGHPGPQPHRDGWCPGPVR
jgi:hypothetical protein